MLQFLFLDKINEIVKSSDVKEYTSYSSSDLQLIGNYTYSKEYLDFYKNAYGEEVYNDLKKAKYQNISILVLDDNSYNKYKKLIGLDKDSVILLNKFKGVSYGGNKRVNYDIPVINNGNINIKICNFDDSEEEVNDVKWMTKEEIMEIYNQGNFETTKFILEVLNFDRKLNNPKNI